MAGASEIGGSKKRKRGASSGKAGRKLRFPKQSKPAVSKRSRSRKKSKAKHSKPNLSKRTQSEKSGFPRRTIMEGELGGSKKRKREHSLANKGENTKLPKESQLAKASSFKENVKVKQNTKPDKPIESDKPVSVSKKKERKTPKDRRLAAEEMAEERKKKRKPNYNLNKELAYLWEKMRCCSIGKEERSKLVSEALKKMSGKFEEIARSHVSARVLQTCIKYGSQEERHTVFEALRPHLVTLSRKKYAVHLVKKLLDNASKKQLEGFFSSLRGHVGSLIRHTVGSAVVEHVYLLGSGSQRRHLLMEMCSTNLQLFKDLTLTTGGSLVEIISELGLQKSSVLQRMTSIIQPLLQKGILDYSIIHTALVEYFAIADKSAASDVIQLLLPLLSQEFDTDENPHLSINRKFKRNKMRVPFLVKMVRTRDGLKVGILCIKHGTAKDRKKIIKGIKDYVRQLAFDQYGCLLLSCILSVVDDTKLVTKIIIRELQEMLKELVVDKNGRRLLLLLLHPQCHRYFTPDDLACLNSSIPSLCSQDEKKDGPSEAGSKKQSEYDTDINMKHNSEDNDSLRIVQSVLEGKKDPYKRREELLVESGLAENLIATCIDNADELLRSNFGREVIFEVAVGGSDGILQSLDERLSDLHTAIASFAALPKSQGSEEEHVFENFYSSRTIRKLVLGCPAFAETLWKMALEGKSEIWARGHSSKVVAAFLESELELAKSELLTLVDRGILELPAKSEQAAFISIN